MIEHMDETKAEALRIMIDNIVRQVMLISLDDAAQLVREVEYHEAFSPFYDPTWFMQNADTMRTRRAIFQAFVTFRSALAQIKQNMEK